ncbi:MAG: NAD(P)/FAD-dependent oxidoreductase [Spirochaetaceae bacterium JB067]
MKKIVIAGGGIAALVLAKNLEKSQNVEITLVEPKDYFEVPYAQLRALVEPDSFSRTIRAPYGELLKEVTHIRKKAERIAEDTLVLADGSTESFDFLVLATGSGFSRWPFLKSGISDMESRQKQVEKESEILQKAESVLIVGGGSVGVELAGEIAYTWPHKKISLVTGSDRLMKELDKKASRRAHTLLSGLGVEIRYNTRIDEKSDGVWKNDQGDIFSADVIYPVTGSTVNSGWLESSGIPLNERKAVCVDNHLRVKGYDSIFAIGDINDVAEQKLGALATKQANVASKNILKLIADQKAPLLIYKPAKAMGFIPIGQKKGVVQISSMHPNFLISMKQRDLFVSMYIKNR